METILKVAIAGYGVVGGRRRQYIDLHPHLKTVAVCDQKLEDNVLLASGVRAHTNYLELFKEKFDVLFVCLPNYLAPEVTVHALDKGIHVFCEKPPGRNVEDIRNVIAAEARNPGLKLKYGFNHRYHNSVREALRIVRSGELGEVVNLRGVYGKSTIVPFLGNWRAERKYAGGGILLDQGIHMVDLMSVFCGDFIEVKSFVSNNYWNADVEDNAYALMKDTRGRVAMLHSSATQWQHRFSLDVSCENGFLELHGILSGTKSYGEEELVIGRRDESHTGSLRSERIKFLEDPSWGDEINEYAEAILNDRPIEHGSSAQALRTMELVYAIYEADPHWSKQLSTRGH